MPDDAVDPYTEKEEQKIANSLRILFWSSIILMTLLVSFEKTMQ